MIKVLLIDDNVLTLKIAKQYLEGHGCAVEACNGPFGVLQKVKDFKPDVVLLDLNMPGLSGQSLAGMLKEKKGPHGGFKVVALSGEDEHFQRELVEKGSIDGYFVKSGSLNGLYEKIEEETKTAMVGEA